MVVIQGKISNEGFYPGKYKCFYLKKNCLGVVTKRDLFYFNSYGIHIKNVQVNFVVDTLVTYYCIG